MKSAQVSASGTAPLRGTVGTTVRLDKPTALLRPDKSGCPLVDENDTTFLETALGPKTLSALSFVNFLLSSRLLGYYSRLGGRVTIQTTGRSLTNISR